MKKMILFLALAVSLSFANAQKVVRFAIHTDYGTMKGYLYNETPLHRDNFVKLVKQGWYNNSPFHRVISNFMIQGGQNADGRLDPGNKISAEFNPKFFHKKGALAAARMGDQVNPKKESSGSQFYIVQGNILSDQDVSAFEARGTKFTPEQLKAYKTIGGTPHLDGGYTVYGEITEGLDVIDKIAAVKTLPGDRPEKDLKMRIEIIK
ncbi:MAG: peptidylprolyl isomerase [Bacteroidales bacterium]|jgi:peptidyl-prolyl cis-trans isomerase B (cyclophilin B)|nr:peptidylprolyl isomerase [Bacteroidales bacterium]